MALHTDDTYQIRPALETIEAVKVYGTSVGGYGQNSPYLYHNMVSQTYRRASLAGGCLWQHNHATHRCRRGCEGADGKVQGVRCGKKRRKRLLL